MARGGISIEGRAGLVANLHAVSRETVEAIQEASRRGAADVENLARQLAPEDTGRLKRSITSQVSEQGRTFEVFTDPAVFAADEVEDYSPFVEFGTVDSPAQPFLFPAFEAIRPHYLADVSQAIRTRLERLRSGTLR